MPPSPVPARNRLIAAGERLFAERGIDNVSLRELSRAAGARNVMALQHHFTDRDGLLQAILQKHQVRIEARRHQMLDECLEKSGDGGDPPLQALAAALVDPWAQCLVDDDGGRDYLRIFAELVNRPRPLIPTALDGAPGSIERWRALVDPKLNAQQRRLHRRYAAMLYVTTELARWARNTNEPDLPLISASLTDLVVAMLTAPISAATSEELRRRR
ncbi:TetR/AcrR family transcriptional regulator [[Mycobacterium] burgundiense]|uniref:Helix-turn-helix domain-containing protein n=1 Tax=[Mycobacterium] burgundiense TaxID=3064286 RepID=A0ABM9L9S4_9MYCO|nr:TetR/AcrR family transcriptional regulator [Mycolicibacterium sp. MU0053]CAJ1495345.1 helix-turn-helix domain-containing protein [Mycolicibacterium sp. MU0053]